MDLFRGQDIAYGTYKVTGTRSSGKKNGTASTVRDQVTPEVWEQHLCGERGIGIIPIRSNNTASWGCIDIDTYPVDHPGIQGAINRHELPAVMCRSKSGGAHILFFVNEPIPAGDMQDKLEEIAAGLGHGGVEIFPKQAQVLIESGDLGNWLNMPYFDGNRSTRYAFAEDGTALSLNEFLDFAESRRVSPDEFRSLKIFSEQDVVAEGPPCLDALVAQGFPPQTRNNGLFAMGVYFRKSDPDNWEARLEEFNRTKLVPPKAAEEVLQIIKSLRKKDYQYKCGDPPLKQFCNRAVCMTRRHGVGVGGTARARIGGLSKLNTEPPLWFLDVEGVRIELTTKQLQNQYQFQSRVMDAANKMPPLMKAQDWSALINELMTNLTVIDSPRDGSTSGHFEDLVEEFCAGRFQARNMDEILLGKPYTEGDYTLFRLSDLMRFLKESRFDEYGRNQAVSRLKDMRAEPRVVRLAGTQKRVWAIPAFEATENLRLPAAAAAAF